MEEACFLCSELRKVIVRLQEDYRLVQVRTSCPQCEEIERRLASAKGRFSRQTKQLSSEIELMRRRFSEQADTIENLRQTLDERATKEVNTLLDQKDQEIVYLRKKLEDALGKRSEETQEQSPDATRFSLLEVD